MNFNNLKYFITLANELSFSRAAEKLFISQQALSKHIHNIESEYNVQLFERKPKIALTKSGQIMLESAALILELERQLKDRLETVNKKNRKVLTIGMGHARIRLFLPDIFPLYRQRYPNLDLRVVVDSANVLEQMLSSGEIDLWLGYYTPQNERFQYVNLFKDQLCIIIPKRIMVELFGDNVDEMVQRFQKKLEISYFAEYPFLMIPRGNHIREIIDTFLKTNHITPNIALETNDVETLLMLVLEGNGITFASSIFAKKYFNTHFFNNNVYAFLLDDYYTQQNIVISYKRDKHLSFEAQSFIDLCLEVYNS